mmetsp:Transcript_56630/g.152340  ORF Transcript_56630/g.152340 Transcript_56630/m.152340 type:complete len:263 (-) Transcript_56630:302-1090(-)
MRHVGPDHVRPRLRAGQRRAPAPHSGGPRGALALSHAALDEPLDAQGHAHGVLPRWRLRPPPQRRAGRARPRGAAPRRGPWPPGRRPRDEHAARPAGGDHAHGPEEGPGPVSCGPPPRAPGSPRGFRRRLRARGRPRRRRRLEDLFGDALRALGRRGPRRRRRCLLERGRPAPDGLQWFARRVRALAYRRRLVVPPLRGPPVARRPPRRRRCEDGLRLPRRRGLRRRGNSRAPRGRRRRRLDDGRRGARTRDRGPGHETCPH